jgi:hypothetical protein
MTDLALVVKIISEKHLPQTKQVRAVGIAFAVGKMMMLVMNRDPFTRHYPGKEA